MSRPRKAVADYFPHYVNHGKTMFTIENEYGNDGYTFWFKLLEQLAGAEHHYLDCNDNATWRFMLAKSNIKNETAISILETCSSMGAINQDLWKYKIIRSDNLIENLGSLYNRREVTLLSNSEVLALCKEKSHSPIVSGYSNPQREIKDRNEDKSIKEKTKKNEQKREERIYKGNPRSPEEPADISDVTEVSTTKRQWLLEEESMTAADDLDQTYQGTQRVEIRNDTSPIKETEKRTEEILKEVKDDVYPNVENKGIQTRQEHIIDNYGWDDMIGNDGQSESIMIEPGRLENDSVLSQNGQTSTNNESVRSLKKPYQAPPTQGHKSDLVANDSEW